MEGRLGRLEGAFDAFKIVLTVVVAVMIGGFAFLGVQAVRLDGKLSALDAKVSVLSDRMTELPGRISADLRDITRTLAESITAARQTPPQVIIVPAPTAPQRP